MNIFLRELRSNRKSVIIWSVIVILFTVVGFSKFSAFYGNPDLLFILNSMPPALLNALSMNAFNLTTVTGFFGIMIMYFGLVLSIAAVMWGTDIISKEERDRTVEFSLTLPVTRAKVVTAKIAAAAVLCIILLLVTWGATLVNAQNYAPDTVFYKFVAISMLGFLIMQMIFLALGIFLGCAMKRHKRSGSVAVSILLAAYFASVLSGLNEKLEFIKYLTPFKYFDPALMLRETRIELIFVLLSVAIIAFCLVGAYTTYNKRDLYI
jgi:ABC-2 type transport system permease protein